MNRLLLFFVYFLGYLTIFSVSLDVARVYGFRLSVLVMAIYMGAGIRKIAETMAMYMGETDEK